MRKFLIAAGIMLALMFSSVAFQAEAAASPKSAAESVAMERVYGPLYGKYKKIYPRALNWANDGCSVPKSVMKIRGVKKILSTYRKFWEKSCDRHDFGYRNHELHGFSRKTIDKKFRANMKYQCDKGDAPGKPEKVFEPLCMKAADAFYLAVRAGGQDSWN